MPIMDGIEATKCIRETLDTPKCDVPIIAMTAHKNVKDDEKHIQYKMNDCILKPFEPKELFSIIHKYTSNKPSKQEKIVEEPQPSYVDFSYLNLYANDDDEFKKLMIEGILTDTPPHVVKLNKLALDENWEELQKVSHLLKTSFPFIGNETLTTNNEKIDASLKRWKEGELSDNEILELVPPLVETVCTYFNYSISEIYSEYLKLGGETTPKPEKVPTSINQPN